LKNDDRVNMELQKDNYFAVQQFMKGMKSEVLSSWFCSETDTSKSWGMFYPL